jgi:hypothetical protein
MKKEQQHHQQDQPDGCGISDGQVALKGPECASEARTADSDVEQLAADMHAMMAVGDDVAEGVTDAAPAQQALQDAAEAQLGDGSDPAQQGSKQQRKKKKKGKKAEKQQPAQGGGAGGGEHAEEGTAQRSGSRRVVRLPASMDPGLEKYWLQRYSLFSK